MKTRIIIAWLAAYLSAIAAEQPQLIECLPRGGLPNFFAKLGHSESVRIGYFGGSITEQEGWRPKSLNWFRAQYLRRGFHQVRGALRTTVDILAPEGSYRPPRRDLYLEIMMDHAPRAVSRLRGAGNQESQSLARLNDAKLPDYGWNYQSGVLTIRAVDGYEPMRFVLQH